MSPMGVNQIGIHFLGGGTIEGEVVGFCAGVTPARVVDRETYVGSRSANENAVGFYSPDFIGLKKSNL